MPKPPRISDAEVEVMDVLWKSSPLSASEIADAVCARMEWHPKTVKTLLGRLVKKGAVRYREEGNRYLYRPVFSRDRYVEAESRSFVDRVFGGRATPALVHFVETMKLSDEDLQELRSILDRRQKEDERS
ncbi:MAG TPA: BlaI/MecI/CopY family transcriptional regulator [Thermoanaerobaculia bacterium]|nr:BlaI/MecI/CopY family transcriptional regulator [Thermoanaerobaculia bacterium]